MAIVLPPAKVLSLTQPWATLFAMGEKLIETRSWRTYLRGEFFIHASKGFPSDCRDLCEDEPFYSALAKHGIYSADELPLGQILGSVELVDCKPTIELRGAISAQELAFGNYDDGRFGFITRNARPFTELIPAKGALGFWEWSRGVEPEQIVSVDAQMELSL